MSGVRFESLSNVKLRKTTIEGRECSWGASVDHKDIPISKGCVRAVSFITGWHLRPVKDSPDKTLCTRVIHVDLKGWIPSSLINKTHHHTGISVVAIRNYLKGIK